MSWLAHSYIVLLALFVLNSATLPAADGDGELFRQALEHLRANEIAAGRDILNSLLTSQPNNPLYLFNLANVDFIQRRYTTAIVGYTKLQAMPSPLKIPASLYLSSCYLELGQLKSALRALQLKEFPAMRKNYGKISASKLWESNIEVAVFGTGNTTIQFTGGIFANNANKQEFQTSLNKIFHRLRFKKSIYKWYKYDEEYTYYEISSANDGDIVSE